jgi:class 3 adenylate cyclase/tetratricopeptide (TPR) repeat protein
MPVERNLERKIVSILFADLVGFTTLSEQLDAEDVASVQQAYFQTVRETIERYGGRLEKFIGDAAMAVFGVPRTREDDAESAVRAGLALASAVEQLAARIGLEAGALAVRVGVNSGEVIHAPDAGPEEAMVTGDPVNVAARLQAAAHPSEVLVGETTALAAAAAIEFESPRALDLKGKAEKVRARRAIAVRPEHSRDAAMGALRAPLLGRDSELRFLLSETQLAQTEVRRLLVVAPPGTGKTRLVEEVASRARDIAVARARLRPDVLAPFDAVAQLFASAGAAEAQLLTDRFRSAGIAPSRAAVLVEEVIALFQPAGEGAAGRDREGRFLAWLEALDALAGERASLLIVEDVHWAGGDLLAFLALAGEGAGRRLVLATSRPSLLDTARQWCEGASILDLEPLPRVATAELVYAFVGDALPAELVDRIAEHSDGNPLFIEELLRSWVSVGTLVERDGVWTLARSAHDVALPTTVQAIYAAQLDDLPPPARDVARRAAIAGRQFPLAALDPLEVVDGGEGVEMLARRALVSAPAPDPVFGPSCAFRHALLRDAGYASLARADRARLHARFAVWLEGAGGEEMAEPVARHYARAVESMPALAREAAPGLGRDDCRRLAADWFERGAHAALSIAAHESARELMVRALDFTSDDETVERARRLTTLGEATASSADMDEGASLLEQALDAARSAGDRQQIARAAAGLSWVLDQQVQFMPAARMAEGALAEIGEGEDVETALLLVRRATAMNDGGDLVDQPRDDADRALAIARRAGDRRLELEALDLLASLRGSDAEAWKTLELLAVESGAWDTAVGAIQSQALRLVPDRAEEAATLVGRAIELCEARGLREGLAWSHYVAVEMGLASGDWDGAVASAQQALEIGIRNGYDRAVVRTWSAVLPIAAARGDADLLRNGHVWMSERFREPENPSPYALVIGAARQLEIASGGLREPFVPDVEERIGSFELRYSSPSWLAALETVFDSWLAAGELEGAARALERMHIAASGPEVATLGRATFALLCGKLLAARAQDPSEEARRALTGFRASQAPWWTAKALRLLGTSEAVADALDIEAALGIDSVDAPSGPAA